MLVAIALVLAMFYADRWMMVLYRKMAVISYALLDYLLVLDQITEYLLHQAKVWVLFGEGGPRERERGMVALSFQLSRCREWPRKVGEEVD